ncbi:hypothetical protein [Streptomyces sp. H27-S2]|uniref:hypothetical protein n=1 Tax=Streptomyces antarcticus TaxID=2996458 RepID=UPI00226D9838|nr:hypothetical protein [Streptomyces sp. H27-S2]MCY0951092.1 hypothetical protein [Streptomyces sp. H27-S2]
MGDEGLGSVVRAAAAYGLWEECLALALAVAAAVGGKQRLRIARLAARLDGAELDSLVRVTWAEGCGRRCRPSSRCSVRRTGSLAVARPGALRDPQVPAGVVRAVVVTGLWGEFLPLVGVLPRDARQVVADAAAALDDGEPDAPAREVGAGDLWDLVPPSSS